MKFFMDFKSFLDSKQGFVVTIAECYVEVVNLFQASESWHSAHRSIGGVMICPLKKLRQLETNFIGTSIIDMTNGLLVVLAYFFNS